MAYTGPLNVKDCIFKENDGGTNGGAISCTGLILSDTTISGNDSSRMGGGVWCSDAVITNCVITNNKAAQGGGISSSGDVVVKKTTLANNVAQREGGAIYHKSSGSPNIRLSISIINSTITGNRAESGSAIGIDIYFHPFISKGALNVTNSDIVNNTYAYGGAIVYNNDLIASYNNSILNNGDEDQSPNNYRLYAANCLIGARQQNRLGAPVTLPNGHIYYPRLPDSPAINGGDEELIDQSYRDGYDIAGNPRVFGKNIDIGAVEYVPKPVIQSDVTSLQRGCTTTLTAELPDSQFEDCSFVWDLDGDGVFGQSAREIGQSVLFDSFPYAPEVNGKRIVKVLLQDEQGRRGNPVDYGITMEKVMPCYELLMPNDITTKRTAWFEFNASDPAGLAVMDWLISWGDGSEDSHVLGGPRNRVELSHRYMTMGEYSIEITTTNILGEKSTVSMPVSVHDIVVIEGRATDIALEKCIETEVEMLETYPSTFEFEIPADYERLKSETTVAKEAYWRRENQGMPVSDRVLDFIFAHWRENEAKLFSWL